MARPFAKSLEEQLTAAQEELKKAEEKVVTTKQKIADLNHAIRERDKENIFAALESRGMSVEDFNKLLESFAIPSETPEASEVIVDINKKKKRA